MTSQTPRQGSTRGTLLSSTDRTPWGPEVHAAATALPEMCRRAEKAQDSSEDSVEVFFESSRNTDDSDDFQNYNVLKGLHQRQYVCPCEHTHTHDWPSKALLE